MKILQVTAFFSPALGGSSSVPYQLSKELAKKGHQVTIYTSDFRLSHEYINSAPEVYVRPFKTWLSLANFYMTPGIIKRARKEIRLFDIIHMHNYRTFQNIVIHHYAKKHGIPYVLQAHGSLTTFFQRGWLKKAFDMVWGRRLLKDASRVITATRMEGEQYKSMGVREHKIETVPYGIDLSEFDSLPQKESFRKKYNLSSEQRIILYLGRIDKIKGLDLLARAFAQLAHDFPDAKLVITGQDDGYLTTLLHLIKELEIEDRVLLTGPLYGQGKLEAYVDADVYVLPSSYDSFGITVLEACACSTPVIVTDRCGSAEIVVGQAGLVIPFDEEQLKQALIHMLSDATIREEFNKKGRLLVRERFDWKQIAEQMERVYRDVNEGPRSKKMEKS